MKFSHHLLPAVIWGTATVSALVIVQPLPAFAKTGEEVNDIAREVTVLINCINPGSGVIIGKDDNTYYVLTANHVVRTEDEYTIITHDKEPYKVDFSKIKRFPGVDLALVEFTSDKKYRVAELADSDTAREGGTVFVSGWPNPGREIKERIRQFSQGNIAARPEAPLADGYAMIYTNYTRAGMSGGPVLDAAGRLVGIHGRAEGEDPAVLGQESGIPGAGKIAVSLAIPINTFASLAPQAGINFNLELENSPASALSAAYVEPTEPDPRDKIDDINSVLNNIQRGIEMIDQINNIRRRLPF